MLQPFLLIGVGGSGGKTLRVVRDELRRRLAQVGHDGDMPQAWQFLHVDVPTTADGNEADLPPHLPPQQYQGLVAPGLTYRNLDASLAGSGRTAMGDAAAGWRPDPNRVNVQVSKGAGQFRTIGRMIAVTSLDGVRTAVDRARRNITGAEVTGELKQVGRLLGADPSRDIGSPMVLVVASIAGGSGAGAVIDVCDTVRSFGDPWASDIVGLLYAPDVFDYLPEEHRKGVRPNALATMAELLSGYWNTDGPSQTTVDLLAKHGVQLGAADRMGPRYPFLIGNRNEHVSFGTQNDIYRAMGRSIASWVSSESLQDRMTAYTQGNWTQSASTVPDHLPLKSAGTETPFSALGSARVGLGRDRFRDYASQALARRAVERVLRRHEALRRIDDDRSSPRLAEETARATFPRFLVRSGLDERGSENNDIQEALEPTEAETLGHELVASVLARVSTGIPAKGMRSSEVGSRIISELDARSDQYLDAMRAKRTERARVWVADIQRRLTDLVAEAVALDGGPVTALMIDMLVTEVTQVRDELQAEAARYGRWSSDLSTTVRSVVEAGGSDTMLTAATPVIANAVREGVGAVYWKTKEELCSLAVDIVPDLVDGLLRPLHDAVHDATLRLSTEENAQIDGRSSSISTWPQGDEVPRRLRPSANEFPLEKPGEYPAILDRLIGRMVTPEPGVDPPTEATRQVVIGADPANPTGQQLLVQTVPWVPRDHRLQVGTMASPSRAGFVLRLRADELLAAANGWLTTPGTPAGDFTAQSLRRYLDPASCDAAEHADRLQRFEGQFIAALSASAPLVSINPGVLVQVHEEHEAAYSTFFSGLPVSERSPAGQVLTRVLQQRGLWDGGGQRAFTDADDAFIDLFCVLNTPYQPVVFDSLMRPIAAEWGARNKSPDTRAEFWRWRRARPLTEFLPMAPQIRLAMVRGWFTAGLLGQLRLDWQHGCTLFVPSEGGGPGAWAEFPQPLLAADVQFEYEYLPAVLKSVLLAMLDVNGTASLLPMAPYARLRQLGRSGRGGEYSAYEAPATELEDWILRGAVAGGAPVPTAFAGPAEGAMPERREAVLARFAQQKGLYEGLFTSVRNRSDVFDVPRAYELAGDITSALDDLHRAVRHVEELTDAVVGWY